MPQTILVSPPQFRGETIEHDEPPGRGAKKSRPEQEASSYGSQGRADGVLARSGPPSFDSTPSDYLQPPS